MTIFVKKYVIDCDMCQQMKNHPQQPFGPLVPNKVPNRPWEIISIDLITQLPESNGYNAICVIVDRLTKRAHFIPINNQFLSKDMAQLLYDKVYLLHGLPVRATGAQDSRRILSYITVCGYDTTHLQENPQRLG